MKNQSLKPVYFVILGIILGLGGFFVLLANPFGWKFITPVLNIPGITRTTPRGVEPLPAPVLILPKGKQTYYMQGGDTDISKIVAVVVNPLDAVKGSTQSLSVKMNSKEPISSFTVVLNSDSGSTEFPLNLSSGNTTQGMWETQYTLPDSTEKIYNFVFKIITTSDNKTVTTFLVR